VRFDLTQVIDAPVDDVAAAYASTDLYESMGPTTKLGAPEILGRTELDGRVTLRLRYRFIGDLSPAVTAVVDPARLTWVEETVHDLDGLSVAVTLRPDHYADRLRCTGTYRYRSRGDRSERRISGELKVKALLVAGTVERAIVSGLEEHLAAEVAAVERHLAG
jgi:hypothetical protein